MASARVLSPMVAHHWYEACALYEDLYCAKSDMENRIKEQQLALFADHTSTVTLRASRLRLYFCYVTNSGDSQYQRATTPIPSATGE